MGRALCPRPRCAPVPPLAKMPLMHRRLGLPRGERAQPKPPSSRRPKSPPQLLPPNQPPASTPPSKTYGWAAAPCRATRAPAPPCRRPPRSPPPPPAPPAHAARCIHPTKRIHPTTRTHHQHTSRRASRLADLAVTHAGLDDHETPSTASRPRPCHHRRHRRAARSTCSHPAKRIHASHAANLPARRRRAASRPADRSSRALHHHRALAERTGTHLPPGLAGAPRTPAA